MNMNTLTEKSKFVAYVLRHKPEKFDISLDSEGWADIDELVAKAEIIPLSREELETIVDQDLKGRYSIRGNRIRANQGHSTPQVRLSFKSAAPPPVLYHGTESDNLKKILKDGLKPMSRHHVHLTTDLCDARLVGGRRRRGYVVLEVDADGMLKSDIPFFLSENNIWLVNSVPSRFLKVFNE